MVRKRRGKDKKEFMICFAEVLGAIRDLQIFVQQVKLEQKGSLQPSSSSSAMNQEFQERARDIKQFIATRLAEVLQRKYHST